jgi:hypothetical protein
MLQWLSFFDKIKIHSLQRDRELVSEKGTVGYVCMAAMSVVIFVL